MNMVNISKSLYLLIFLTSTINCNKGDGKKLFPDPGFLLGSNALFKVFWSDPGISKETSVDKGIDQEWVTFINGAEKTIDIAAYNLGRQVIIDAIISARERGVKIRLVGDVDESNTSGYQAILKTDIPFSLGNTTGIQHNKFSVRDDRYLIFGTGNLTDTDLMQNNNNYAIIESKTMVSSYKKEFEQMFYGRYAGKKEPKTTNRNHTVNNIPIEIYFSPYDGADAMAKLIELVDNAKVEINYMIFAFTHSELTTALIRAAKRGVLVRGIHDYTFIRGTAMVASRLYNAGRVMGSTGPFNREDGNENTKIPGLRTSGGKLHCKTLIIDGQIVATGSFNWSNNAINNNDENMAVIRSPLVAQELRKQWDSIWNYGRPITNQIDASAGETANPGDVVISEVLWAGSYESGATSGSPIRDDVWIELYNTTNRRIDISNWLITWEPKELTHYQIPDKYSWYEAGVHKLHGGGKMYIEPRGYFLIKNTNDSLPALNPTAFDNNSADIKISTTKNFTLTSSFLNLKLYDLAMNLIDAAGNGNPPAAGIRDTLNFRTHSMERFFDSSGKALTGTSESSWYSSNGNNQTGISGASLAGSGRLSDNFKNCISSGTDINKGCTIGTPNSAIRNNFPSAASNPRGGILNLTNIPIDAYSLSANTAAIRMRWAMVTVPSVTGASSVRLSETDPGLIIITKTQSPGELITVTVQNNGYDITGQLAEGGDISFSGYSNTKAKARISAVWPSQSSSKDLVELEILSGGSLKNLGVYFYDSNSLATPSLLYIVGDIQVAAGEKIQIQLNSSNLISDDKRLGSSPSINKGSDAIWNFYSNDPGLPSTDTILFLSYDTKANPQDLMCYSNRDGSIAQNLMTWGFRFVYQNQSLWNIDNVFPIKDFNDFEIQARCANYQNGGAGKYLTRVGSIGRASDFTCVGCN
jgi:phosphatidylserine/phosphatidylglycerophosphate/cardiolipin synthase-like enzyme